MSWKSAGIRQQTLGPACADLCFILLWTSPGVMYLIPVFTFMKDKWKNISHILEYKCAFNTEAYSHLSETTPAAQGATPQPGESQSQFNLLQAKDSKVRVLLLAPTCQAGLLMQQREVEYRERPG